MVCLTKHNSSLKVTNLDTKQTTIVPTGLATRLSSSFVVSGDGSTAVVEVVEEEADSKNCLLVVSLQTRTVTYKLTAVSRLYSIALCCTDDKIYYTFHISF